MTTHKLELNHAGATKAFGMAMISNAPITQKQYLRWFDSCAVAQRKGKHNLLPNNRDVNETIARLIKQRNHIKSAVQYYPISHNNTLLI
jgi:hypothetical protein